MLEVPRNCQVGWSSIARISEQKLSRSSSRFGHKNVSWKFQSPIFRTMGYISRADKCAQTIVVRWLRGLKSHCSPLNLTLDTLTVASYSPNEVVQEALLALNSKHPFCTFWVDAFYVCLVGDEAVVEEMAAAQQYFQEIFRLLRIHARFRQDFLLPVFHFCPCLFACLCFFFLFAFKRNYVNILRVQNFKHFLS